MKVWVVVEAAITDNTLGVYEFIETRAVFTSLALATDYVFSRCRPDSWHIQSLTLDVDD